MSSKPINTISNNVGANKPKKGRLWNKTRGASLSLLMLVAPGVGATAVFADETQDDLNQGLLDIGIESHWFGNEGNELNVKLLANGVEVDTATLTNATNWNHTFSNLAEVGDNGVITYTIEGADVAGYHTQVSGSVQSGFTIVNLERPDNPGFTGVATSVEVEKNWIGDTGDKAEVELLVDGLVADTVTLDAAGGWNHEFLDLPLVENADGAPVTYTIAELNSRGYDTVINGSRTEGFVVSNIQESNKAVEGGVVTKYVDEQGREIAYRINLSGQIGSSYGLAEKEIPGYKLVETKGDASGNFAVGVAELTYVYELVDEQEYVEGRIISKFVDETGQEIALREHLSGEIGSAYELETKEINGYTFKSVEGPVTGEYEKGINEVVFTYAEDINADEAVIGSIVTKYVNKDGFEISERERVSGDIGDRYHTNWKTIEGYGLVDIKGDAAGEFGQGITIIEYVYDEIEDALLVEEANVGNVIVRHIDKDGREVASSQVVSGEIGKVYTIEGQAIAGYEVESVTGNRTGIFDENTVIVEYVYKVSDVPVIEDEEEPKDEPVVDDEKEDEKVEDDATIGTVTIKYVDANNKEIAESIKLTGKIGEKYETEVKVIEGYENYGKKTEGTLDNVFGDGNTDITFMYRAIDKDKDVDETEATMGTVTVKYHDEYNNEIADSIELSGKIGENYETVEKEIEGYNVLAKEISGEVKGQFTANPSEVIYFYEKVDSATDEDAKVDENGVIIPILGDNKNTPNANPSATVTDTSTVGTTTDSNAKQYPDKPVTQVTPTNTNANATDNTPNNTNNTVGNNQQQDTPVEGKSLASTATNTFNAMVAGVVLLASAIGGLFVINRRKSDEDKELTDTE